jgi:hypothetical protein
MDEKKNKQKYEKPKITRIELDTKCAVLGFCQNTGQGGPVVVGCEDGIGGNCLDIGS